jgi:site-specific recombinase XerD
MNIGKCIQSYSEELRFKNYSKNTIDNYACQVEVFLKYFNGKVTKPSEINEKQIKDWLMLANGIELALIQKVAGHKNIKTTAIYAKITPPTISRLQAYDF